jgi:hypothetical protein
LFADKFLKRFIAIFHLLPKRCLLAELDYAVRGRFPEGAVNPIPIIIMLVFRKAITKVVFGEIS